MATPPIQVEHAATAGRTEDPGPTGQAILDLRQAVLEELDGLDYRPIARIPREWPVIRSFVQRTVRALSDEGFLESTALPGRRSGGPGYRMTAAGRRELQRLRSAADPG